jgi:hypothetical protein
MSFAIPALACISAYTTTKLVRCQDVLRQPGILNEGPTAKAIENMMVDAMLAAEPYLKIASNINDPKKFLGLTDDIRTEIQRSQAPVSINILRFLTGLDDNTLIQELLEAQRILERIQNRDLYRCVDYKVFDWEHRELLEENITAAGIVSAAKELSVRVGRPASGIDPKIDDEDAIAAEGIEDLTPDKVIVTFCTMHYGMKDKNPLDFVKFYPKSRPNGMLYCIQTILSTIYNKYLECFHARRGDLSLLMPKQFGEVLLRVYTKDVRFVHHLIGWQMYFQQALQILWYCPVRLPLLDLSHHAVRAHHH